ncbi:MAG: amidase [Deltaproteobacteria bacterium]|nr:amidase [Deltaproteobacteria bacterium]
MTTPLPRYHRPAVKAPRVGGRALRAFAAAVEGPLGGLLLERIKRDSGFDLFRHSDPGPAPPLPPALPHPTPLPVTDAPHALAAQAVDVGVGVSGGDDRETVAAFRAAYAGGLSPVDVVARLERGVAHATDAGMGFFIARRPELLDRDAVASAERHKRGCPLSALDGVPVVIKDELDVQGYATTLGTRFRRDVAEHDSTVVARLKAAGALILGKGNMNEVGINPIGLNPHWGVCRNPWDRTKITGGSSSASAATVAAGLCPLSIGADGGGSIRIPAALCGVVGLKATHGRVPETGVPPLCWTPGHAGPFGLTVADVAAGYAIVAGRDEHDVASHKQPPPSLQGLADVDVRGLRVGVCRPYFEDADADVVARAQDALRALREAGCVVVELTAPPDLNRVLWAHATIILSEMAAALRDEVERDRSRFALDSRINLALGGTFSATDYVHALRHRHAITVETWQQLQQVDVIASPTTACTAPAIPERTLPDGESNLVVVDALMRFIRVANLTGFPALSVPCGFDAQGLPVGFHLMGRPWEEHTLLRLGRVVEAASPRRTPRVHARALR